MRVVRSLLPSLSSFTLACGAFALLALSGCSKSSADTSVSSSENASGETKAEKKKGETKAENKAAGKAITIAKLGLKGVANGETEDPIIGDGDPIMIMAAFFAVNVAEAKATDPKKVKDGEEAAKMFNPKDMKSEKLSDGWAITFKNTGSAGDNYFVSVRREIGGKAYLCDTTQSTPEQQKLALDFCKSLSK